MCRSIKTMRRLEPAPTAADVEAAALQFVRKLSGYRQPSAANRASFDGAVAEISAASLRLLDGIGVEVQATEQPVAAGAAS